MRTIIAAVRARDLRNFDSFRCYTLGKETPLPRYYPRVEVKVSNNCSSRPYRLSSTVKAFSEGFREIFFFNLRNLKSCKRVHSVVRLPLFRFARIKRKKFKSYRVLHCCQYIDLRISIKYFESSILSI